MYICCAVLAGMYKKILPKFVVVLFLLIWSWLNVAQLYAQVGKSVNRNQPQTSYQFSETNSIKKISEAKQIPMSFSFLSETFFEEELAEEDIDEKEQQTLRFLAIYYKFRSAVLTQNQQTQLLEVQHSCQEILQPPFFVLYHSFKGFLG